MKWNLYYRDRPTPIADYITAEERLAKAQACGETIGNAAVAVILVAVALAVMLVW